MPLDVPLIPKGLLYRSASDSKGICAVVLLCCGLFYVLCSVLLRWCVCHRASPPPPKPETQRCAAVLLRSRSNSNKIGTTGALAAGATEAPAAGAATEAPTAAGSAGAGAAGTAEAAAGDK